MSTPKLDQLDYRILGMLSQDARKPYLEIARECGVSGAAIHQRITKLNNMGVIKGSISLILIAIGLWLLITGIMTLIGGIKGKSNKPVKKEKEKKSKQKENQFDEEVEYEAPQELDYTADVPSIEEKKEEPAQEVVDQK